MRYVPFEHINTGMILGRSVYNDNGGMLVKDGCAVSEAAIRHFTNLGIQGIYIAEDSFEDIVPDDILDEKTKNGLYDALEAGDYTKCVALAKNMVAEIKYVKEMTINLVDIKTFKNYEYHHCVSVAMYSVVLGYKLGLKEEQLQNLAVAGVLHDIGKFDVKKRVLNSKKVYGDKQMDEMMKHPMYSYEAVKENPSVSSVSRNSILFHHENLDGSGYYKIPGEKIGLFPRILRIADTYDALTATRRHRNAFSPAAAFKCIVEDAGRIYDKELVRTFITTFPMYPKGFMVKLSDGDEAVVLSQTDRMERPIVRKRDGLELNLCKPENADITIVEDMI